MSHLNARLTRSPRPRRPSSSASPAPPRLNGCAATGTGRDGLRDRCSRPHRSPRLTASPAAAGDAPPAPGARLGATASLGTWHGALHRLRRPPQGRAPPARPEAPGNPRGRALRARTPGELRCPGAEKPGRIPPGGGKRFAPGVAGTGGGPVGKGGGGPGCVHVAAGDRSRCACAGALPDERGPHAAAFPWRAVARFAGLGVRAEWALTDNGGNYPARPSGRRRRSSGVGLWRTRPHRPQTDGQAEASVRILQAGRAYRRPAPRTGSGSPPSRLSCGNKTTTVRTAASAGPSLPPACKQRLWDLQLATCRRAP